jgi:hypothetical protein
MGEINHYLGALAIGLLVLNLTALVLLAPHLRLRGSAYFPTRPPAWAAAPSPVATIDAAIRSGT